MTLCVACTAIVRDAELRYSRRGVQSMGMAATQTHWTVDMVHALPDDGNRYEIIDGELLVTLSPSFDHQAAAFRLVQPDVFVVPPVHGKRPRAWHDAGRPLVAVEVVSPGSSRGV